MATREEILGELYRRGALDGRQKAAFEEASRRGLMGSEARAMVDAKARVRSTPAPVRAFTQGVSMGFADELDAGSSGIETAIGNIGRRLTGKPIPYTGAEARRAVMSANRQEDAEFSNEHPVASVGLNLAGGLATPGAAGASGFVTGARSLPGVIMRSAAVGAGVGAAGGFGSAEGTFADRLDDAAKGAAVGAAVGGAVPAAARTAQAAGNMVSRVGRTGVRAANRATGGALLNPQRTAASRIGEALRADGVDQASAARAIADWNGIGAVPPALMNIAGRNTRRLLRAAAAPGGEAETTAANYASRTTADLQDRSTDLARRLTPYEGRNAEQFGGAIDDAQRTTARVDYAAPYAEQVEITPEILSAVADEPGRAAINRAMRGAVANRDENQVAELRALMTAIDRPGTPVPPISAASLDRIQMSMGERGRALRDSLSNPQRDVARGMFDRQADLNTSLDEIPSLAPARSAYRSFAQNRDALEIGNSQPFSSPDSFAAELGAITGDNPMARMSAGVGLRSRIVEDIGSGAANGTGYLNRLSTGTNTGRVLGETFGDELAGQFRAGVGNEIRRVNDARFIDPSTNSQTASRQMDEGLIDAPTSVRLNPVNIALDLVDKVRRAATLTDAERQAIVEIGTGDAQQGLAILQQLGAGNLRAHPVASQILARLGNASAATAAESTARPSVYVESVGNQRFDPYGQPIP